MGQPPPVQSNEPAMWVKSRQYTGRVVTISNAKIFDEPVYNYTYKFPYLWEEMTIPIPYTADRVRAERILLEVAQRHTLTLSELSEETLRELQRRYFIEAASAKPRVYFNLTDNWLALTVRFIVRDHGIRELKDAITREILKALDEADIGIASATLPARVPPITGTVSLGAGPDQGAAPCMPDGLSYVWWNDERHDGG